MFKLEELLSKRNIRDAFAYLDTKKDSCGSDGMRLSELKDYWSMNQARIRQEIEEERYNPGIVSNYEILNGRGKRRTVSQLTALDCFITKLIEQKLTRYMDPAIAENSYAYRKGKGIQEAVMAAKTYIEAGNRFLVENIVVTDEDAVCIYEMESLKYTKKEQLGVVENHSCVI
jgi:retron-type reverse transcriptase